MALKENPRRVFPGGDTGGETLGHIPWLEARFRRLPNLRLNSGTQLCPVAHHITAICSKTGAANRTEATRHAIRDENVA